MQEAQVIAGRYRLVSLLGEGGMGAVWRAEHLDLGAPVAVKLLNPLIAESSEGLNRFYREAEAAAALRSPHVVQILDRGVDPQTQQPFIVMELMEGESLAGRIAREGSLSAALTSRVVTHIARALTRAHEIGIVHRDLKPDNVFLIRNEDEEIAKVLDFGIAKAEKLGDGQVSQTRTGAVMGTPYYMSPEQISGSKAVDYRTDLWALAVIACECLTGQRPFEADSVGGLALKICADAMPVPSRLGFVPQGFDTWFARAAMRDPAARFASAREAAEELRRICGTLPAPAFDREEAPARARVETVSLPSQLLRWGPQGAPEPVQTMSTGALVRTLGNADPSARQRRRWLGWAAAGGAVLVMVTVPVALWLRNVLDPGAGVDAKALASAVRSAAAPPRKIEASAFVPSSAIVEPKTSAVPAAPASELPSVAVGNPPSPTAAASRPAPKTAVAPVARPSAPKAKSAVPFRPKGLGTAISERK